MSLETQRWVWSLDLPPSTKLVAVALAHFAHPDGSGARPSLSTLSQMTCLNPRSVSRHLTFLREQNVIDVEKNAGRGRATSYYFDPVKRTTLVSTFTEKGRQIEHKRTTLVTQKDDTGVVLVVKSIEKNKSNDEMKRGGQPEAMRECLTAIRQNLGVI